MSLFNKTKTKPSSTQKYLDVSEVRDGLVVLKDGNLRSILAVSSINFALKAEDEQQAIIAAYQNFLNGLDFPIQILMQSRPMNIEPYLDSLKDRMNSISNKLLQMQTAEYVEFITQLVEAAHIMSKTFYVVVPMNINTVREGFFSRISQALNPGHSVALERKVFEEYKEKLNDRTNQMISGLGSMGLDAIKLNTGEIVELLYSSYNIGAASTLHARALGRIDIEGEENYDQ